MSAPTDFMGETKAGRIVGGIIVILFVICGIAMMVFGAIKTFKN